MTNYYVAKGGNDADPGTEAEPWLTIQKAADTLVAGDTVYIKVGTYNEKVAPQNNGSSGNYIIYSAYSNDITIIDGDGITVNEDHGIFDNTKNYIKILSIQTKNSEWAGIRAGGADHVTIKDCYIYNTDAPGILVHQTSTNITVDNNEVEKASQLGTAGEAITIAATDGFEIKNNHVHHCKREGIDAKSGCSNGTIYKNHVHDVDRMGIYTDAYNGNNHDINIYENLVHNCNHGIHLEIEGSGSLSNINVYNNIVYNNTYYGIIVGKITSTINVINNTCHGNGGNAIRLSMPADHNFTLLAIRNNILSGSDMMYIKPGYPHADITIDHNLFSISAGSYGTDKIIGDPKFVNPVIDFHLQFGSPAINAGSSVDAPNDDYEGNARPYDTDYDIGAYESSEKVSIHLESIKMEDIELSDIRDLKIIEGIDEIAKATFRMPTRTLTGFEDIKIEVNKGSGYKRRFWGNIKSYIETEYNEMEIEAESKEALFKGENVPYTEVAYTSKTGDWIVKQLVLNFLDWCDTSALAVLDSIGYVHFVEGNILDALTEIAEMCNKFWFWEPEDGKIRFVESGDLASGTTINTEYISEEGWIKDETEIKNMIHIKGGHIDGNPSNGLIIKIAWDGESDQQYGRREYTHACEEIINESTAQKLADGLLALYKDPIETGEAFDVPYDELLKVGRTVAISQTLHDGTYLIKRIEIDFEYETMNIQFSEMPWMLSHEIRDMQKELAILKRNAINTYESGKPILIKKELLKRGSTVSLVETYNDEMELPIVLPGIFVGGLSLISDSIHKRY